MFDMIFSEYTEKIMPENAVCINGLLKNAFMSMPDIIVVCLSCF